MQHGLDRPARLFRLFEGGVLLSLASDPLRHHHGRMTALMISWPKTRELLTPDEMARADAAAIGSGVSGLALMEKAGEVVADVAASLVLPLSRSKPRIAVLCGPGNNGGDGYVAARLLAGRGMAVICFTLGDPTKLQGDAASAAAAWSGACHALRAFDPDMFDLVIDALFGAGLTRDLEGEAVEVAARIYDWRNRGGRVLAVDMPSGLDGRTGRVRGTAVEADATVTFFRLKPGHVLMPGRALCGDLHLAHIGMPEGLLDHFAVATFLNGPALWGEHLPKAERQDHKYARGHVLVVSGPVFHTGAARLAAQGAARAGAGLVTLAGTTAALSEHAFQVTAIMCAPLTGASDLIRLLADPRKTVVVIGPGLGLDEEARSLLEAVVCSDPARALVLDADALTLMAGDMQRFCGLIKSRSGTVVLTPHDGEFKRLANGLARQFESVSQAPESISQVADSKLEQARWLAASTGATVLLKGADSLVAMPDGRASIATDLPAELATAGSGDVLAGIIGGLLAQGMPAFEAASAAVWLHGRAGNLAGRGLVADDLPTALACVLAGL